jgi:hypothetical protein
MRDIFILLTRQLKMNVAFVASHTSTVRSFLNLPRNNHYKSAIAVITYLEFDLYGVSVGQTSNFHSASLFL